MDTNSPVQPAARQKGWKRFLSFSVIVAFIFGILFAGVFNMALDWTVQESFCLSCHEMEGNYREYQMTIHYSNRSGVRATCSDCHVPTKEFFPKIIAKIQASNQVWHKILGTIDTPEKFAARRGQMAQKEWQRMKANDSKECRDCHDQDSFDLTRQGYRAVNQHEDGLLQGQTCIDCHKGIAHKLPRIDQGINLADPPGIPLEVFRPPAPAQAATADAAK